MNLNKIIGASMAAFLLLTQSACLKDQLGNTDPKAGTNNVVEFQNTSIPVSYTSIWPQYDNGITLTGDTGSFPINVNYTGTAAVTPQDITVTLTLDTAALNAFNADQGTNDTTAPADDITYPTTITIPKGTNTAQIHAVITTNADWDYTRNYALPLHISASSYGIVSSNFGTAIFTFVANNKFAGTYTTTGYFFHPSAPRALSADYPVATTGQYENKFPYGDLGSANYYFAATTPSSGSGALTGYRAMGSTPASPSSGFMTADNPGGIGYSSAGSNQPGTAPWLSSTYNNSYDATNMTYWIHVGYGGGSLDQTGYTRQVYMKMVKK